jgi:hypothetical protein
VTSTLWEKNYVSQQKIKQKIQVSYDCYSPCIRSFGWLKGLLEYLYVERSCRRKLQVGVEGIGMVQWCLGCNKIAQNWHIFPSCS